MMRREMPSPAPLSLHRAHTSSYISQYYVCETLPGVEPPLEVKSVYIKDHILRYLHVCAPPLHPSTSFPLLRFLTSLIFKLVLFHQIYSSFSCLSLLLYVSFLVLFIKPFRSNGFLSLSGSRLLCRLCAQRSGIVRLRNSPAPQGRSDRSSHFRIHWGPGRLQLHSLPEYTAVSSPLFCNTCVPSHMAELVLPSRAPPTGISWTLKIRPAPRARPSRPST